MDEYGDKTESSDGFEIVSLRHTLMFKAMDEYGDKTQSSDDFVIVMLKHYSSKAMDEYDETQSSDGFALFIVIDTLKCSTQ